jgi:hypothetical protein
MPTIDPKADPPTKLPGFLQHFRALTLEEVTHVQGFMQLLMKERNGTPWSNTDKAAILSHLKHFGRSLPYLALFTLPGGTLLLPGLAWFLDRRKDRKLGPLPAQEDASALNLTMRPPDEPPDSRV